MTRKTKYDPDNLVHKLKYEIRKRDVVISHLRESRETLRRAVIRITNLITTTPEENLNHNILNEDDNE